MSTAMSSPRLTDGIPTLEFRSEATSAARQRLLLKDLIAGIGLWRLVVTLSWLDIRLRYRGSILGPFWLTLSTAVMITAMGILYATLFKLVVKDYIPFLALSIVLWNFISAVTSEGCGCFLENEGLIRSVRMPFSVYVARCVLRNIVVLGHNVVVIVGVFLVFQVPLHAMALLAVPAGALWVIDALAICAILGALCARFRDISPIVASVMQIAFFITPVMWKPELLQPRTQEVLPLNPFYSLIEIMRGPLSGYLPGAVVWASAIIFSALLVLCAWLLLSRVRGRIAFWV